MAISTKSVTLDGLKYNVDDRDRVAAKLAHVGTDAPITTNHPITTDGRPIFGSYHGLAFGTPAVSTNATTLVVDQINAPVYTGGAALTATLPAATVGATCVYLVSQDVAGGTATLTIDCAGSDVLETGSVIPTCASNLFKYDVSTANETSIVYTPTNDTVNFLSYGSTIEFVCVNAGKWFVHANVKADIGVTAGACTGTLLFAS